MAIGEAAVGGGLELVRGRGGGAAGAAALEVRNQEERQESWSFKTSSYAFSVLHESCSGRQTVAGSPPLSSRGSTPFATVAISAAAAGNLASSPISFSPFPTQEATWYVGDLTLGASLYSLLPPFRISGALPRNICPPLS